MNLKLALFSPSSLKHIRWRFRTCVSSRVSVKRYVQNKILRRCASMHNKWYYSSFWNSPSFVAINLCTSFLSRVSHRISNCRWPDTQDFRVFFIGFPYVFHRCDRTACWSHAEQEFDSNDVLRLGPVWKIFWVASRSLVINMIQGWCSSFQL